MANKRIEARPGLTTGQVSGFTGLSEQLIARYVRRWPAAFASSAKQAKRGRRWNRDDIMRLLRIHWLMSHHRASAVPLMLAGKPPADLPHMDLYNLIAVYANIDRTRRAVTKMIAEADRLHGVQKMTQSRVTADLRDFNERCTNLADRLHRVELDLAVLQHPRGKEAKHRGLMDLIAKLRSDEPGAEE